MSKLDHLKRNADRDGWGRWIRTEHDERALLNGCTFDERRGMLVVHFCERFLRHFEGRWAGRPFVPLPWQFDELIMPMFCWIRPDGTRRFRKVSVWISKKNGKTTLMAAMVHIGVIADGEPGAEVYAAATARDQAAMIYRKAELMARASPELDSALTYNPSKKRFTHTASGSFFQAISADANVNEGINPSFLVKDEVHAWKGRAGRELDATLRYATVSRDQPIEVEISTAGDDELSIGYELYRYACNVRDGVVNDWTFLPVIHEAAADADPEDESQWSRANPSLGETITIERMREDWRAAKQRGPVAVRDFKRYRMGIWVTKSDQWIDPAAWARCCHGTSLDDLDGMDCWGGLDLSLVNDTTALVLAFVIPESDLLAFYCESFLPADVVLDKERDHIGSAYAEWAAAGLMHLTDGNVTDFGFIHDRILQLRDRFNIREIAFDPYRSQQLIQDLDADGLTMVEFRQSYVAMSAPVQAMERRTRAGTIDHMGNPLLTWQVCNARTIADSTGNVKIDKRSKGRKVDAAVAAVMASARAESAEVGGSVYDGGEGLFL